MVEFWASTGGIWRDMLIAEALVHILVASVSADSLPDRLIVMPNSVFLSSYLSIVLWRIKYIQFYTANKVDQR